jgi:hypothetical protein
VNLKDSLARDGRKDPAFFFQVGLQVAQALDYTHDKSIIHRDIKPQNIIVGKAWKNQRGVNVKVLDFGVARLAEAMHFVGSKDGNTNPRAFEEAAGTPLYMAPEQTSLMDAPVDHRVDLYSLGCVLYEILAGKPPFTANSREKLEKQHVFADPEPLTALRPDVPLIIENIVHRLLAKHPDERYQTAFALTADLLRAKEIYESKKGSRRSSTSFPIGLKDRFQAVSWKLRLLGREEEMNALIEGYDSVATKNGRSRLILVKGSAGIGKSRLLTEFRSYLAERKVRFISGSFSQHENALPFNALANAFNEYLYRVLKRQPHEVEELKRRVKATLGAVAHDIATVVPGLKPFLSDIPEEDDPIQPDEANFKKWAKAFSDFTRCLGDDNQPVVFIFDDLHWADDKSLDLIDQFFSNANTQKFYMVIGQRLGAHANSERFQQFIKKFGKLRRRFQEVDLEPLQVDAVQGMVEDMLSSVEGVSKELTEYLYSESAGNPMYLVELTRTLVKRDLIRPTSGSKCWEYDVDELKNTQLQLNTVDLVLSRIQNYENFDREILELASVAGISFQFEVLLLSGRSQSMNVMKTLQRATEDGLIVRITDESELRHLGKTFMFAHKKARDAIYERIDPKRRRELHCSIGVKLETAIQNPSEKALYTLVHHFNCALDNGKTDNQDLATRCLRNNIAAGYSAQKNQAWQTAETYFTNAMNLMSDWADSISSYEERAAIMETLADLLAAQKRHGHALRKYRELLGYKLPLQTHASLASKAVHFQLVNGIISESANLIEKTLRKLHRRIPKMNMFHWLSFLFYLAIDLLPQKHSNKRLYNILRYAYILQKKDEEAASRKAPAIELYSAGTTLYLRDQPKMAMIYHDHMLKEAASFRGTPASLISAVAERAALLGYLGFTKTAYRFFDLAMEVSKSLKLVHVFGYIALLRVLTIDFLKARHDEISDNLNEAMSFLSSNKDRLAYGTGLLFKIYRELERCNFTALYKYAQRMPFTIPTRNWLSPRAVAMMLYGHLLQGSRDSIVRHGEMFLKRRYKVRGRRDDLFIRIIHTLISFARGETDKTRHAYVSTMQDFIAGQKREFLFPFEEDFVGLFAFTFPILFEQEYGRHLMRDAEMHEILSKLQKRVAQLKGPSRAVPVLLKARVQELLGNDKKIRAKYDQTLRSSKVAGSNLVQIFAYLWFGTHLLDRGQSQKKDYVKRAYLLARKHQLSALAEYIEKMMEKRHIVLKEANLVEAVAQTTDRSIRRRPIPSELFLEHLHHICDSGEADTSLEEDMAESFHILEKYYETGRIFCILTHEDSEKPIELWPRKTDKDTARIIDYIEPYFNIRSTLFLPLNDAPWISHVRDAYQALEQTTEDYRSKQRSMVNEMVHETVDDANPRDFEDDATMVMEDGSAGPPRSSVPSELLSVSSAQMPSESRSSVLGASNQQKVHRLQMSALIPLRTDFGTVGVVFIEDIGELHNRDTTLCRHELDQFGAQLAIMIERKAPSSVSLTEEQYVPRNSYQAASFNLEEVSWMRMWQQGRMRSRRETSWFLGMSFGPEQYVMCYCLLNGNDQIREHLGSMLWHHLHVIRALAVASGRRNIETRELRDEFAGLFSSVPRTLKLDGVSLAFTIFDKVEKIATSGHFGPARPYVIGVENVVTPYNDIYAHFANGRDLRYWEVSASLENTHAYVLSYDTSRLDVDMSSSESYQKRAIRSLIQARDQSDLHKILKSMVVDENLPRYYVAAVMKPQAQGEEEFYPLDKAE